MGLWLRVKDIRTGLVLSKNESKMQTSIYLIWLYANSTDVYRGISKNLYENITGFHGFLKAITGDISFQIIRGDIRQTGKDTDHSLITFLPIDGSDVPIVTYCSGVKDSY